MAQQRRNNLFRLILIGLALTGAIIFTLLVTLSFEFQKSWIDKLASDGNVESYTFGIYTSVKYCAGPLTLLLLGVLVFLIGFKDRANSLIDLTRGSSRNFIYQREHELRDILQAITPTKEDTIPLLILSLIIIFGAFFRYAYLWKPMGHDETYTFMVFASRGFRIAVTDYHLPNNHVFHTILVNLTYQLFGDSPPVVRLPAFLAGVLIIPATYFVGKIYYNSHIGLVGAGIYHHYFVFFVDHHHLCICKGPSKLARMGVVSSFFRFWLVYKSNYDLSYRHGIYLVAAFEIYPGC
jgi:hypothetical protein